MPPKKKIVKKSVNNQGLIIEGSSNKLQNITSIDNKMIIRASVQEEGETEEINNQGFIVKAENIFASDLVSQGNVMEIAYELADEEEPDEELKEELAEINQKYQELLISSESQISKSLSDKEITATPEEQKIINKTILFLGTKELFINYRQATINNLIDCYNKLEKRLGSKLNKFTTAVSMTNIAGKLANIVPGGGVAEAPIGIVGDAINLTGTIVKEKDLDKFTKQFQEILAKDKKTLSLFDGNYLSLVNTIWGGNKTNEQGEIVSTIISTLNLVKTELSPFSNDHNAFSQSVSGVWQGRSSIDLGEMKSSIEAVINNFQELKQKLQDQKEQLNKQDWFKTIEEKTDLLQEQQQSQIQINPANS